MNCRPPGICRTKGARSRREAPTCNKQVIHCRIRLGGGSFSINGMCVLNNICSGEIIDLIPSQRGFLFSIKTANDAGRAMVVFRYYDQESGRVAELTKRQYIQIKFGPNGRLIADELGDFVTCEAAIFPNLTVLALYKNGKMAIFDSDGSVLAEKELIYRGCPASSPAIDGKYIWCVVPDINAIIRYSPQEDRVALRVGGGKIPAFGRPESLSIYIDKIYVCCPGLRKIRSVELSDYSVKDYLEFEQPVYKYCRVYGREYAVLSSGLYELG